MDTLNSFTNKSLQAIGMLLLAMVLFAATASLADEAGTLLVVGNSLGRHGPAPSIGWNADNGMAASSQEHDYAHLLLKKLNLATGKEHRLFITRVVDESNIGSLPAELPKQADAIVLQIGDNYKQKLDRAEAMRRYRALVTGLKKAYPSAAIVCASPWKCAGGDFMQEVAQAENVPFANIKPLGGKPGMDGIGYSSWAVNWHPGDRGMEAIADTIWEKLSPQIVKSRAIATLTGVVPEVQEANLLSSEEFLLTKEMLFHAPLNASAPLRHLLEELSTECGRRFGIAPAVAYDLQENDHLLLAAPDANAHYVPAPSKGYDAYSIAIVQNAITISAATGGDGLFYGLQDLTAALGREGRSSLCGNPRLGRPEMAHRLPGPCRSNHDMPQAGAHESQYGHCGKPLEWP